MARTTDIILLLVCVVTVASADLNKGIRRRVAERLKELGLENKDPSGALPVHSRETRESKDCPNITEDLVTFELNFTDGLKPTSILLQQVVKNDVSYETYGARYFGKEWIIGTVNVRPYLNCLLWDSEDLVEAVRKMIVPPSNLPYNFSLPLEQLPATTLVGEVEQPKEVDDLVYGGRIKDGFFLEAGAHNFETNSDSLYWEIKHGWRGLLVEPHPLTFRYGLTKQRRAHSVQTCLSPEPRPATLLFDPHGSVRNETLREAMSGLVPEEKVTAWKNANFEMQCMPLYTLLLAMGNPTVHHFSLDVEGAEFPILKTIPWDKVDIRALSVETYLAGRLYPGDQKDLIAYMEKVGYRHIHWAHQKTNKDRMQMGTHDDLFVRNDVTLEKEQSWKKANLKFADNTKKGFASELKVKMDQHLDSGNMNMPKREKEDL